METAVMPAKPEELAIDLTIEGSGTNNQSKNKAGNTTKGTHPNIIKAIIIVCFVSSLEYANKTTSFQWSEIFFENTM